MLVHAVTLNSEEVSWWAYNKKWFSNPLNPDYSLFMNPRDGNFSIAV